MSSLLERVLKNSTIKGGAKIDKSAFFGIRNTTPTELPILNLAFSGELDGGFAPGLTVIAGESKSFKTLLTLYCMKAFLDKNKDGIGVIYDSEYGITPSYLKSRGIDTERVIHFPVEDVEQLKFEMTKQLKDLTKKDKVFIMIDSIGNLASKKEVEDAENEKSVADMSRAKAIKSLFRIITPYLTKNDIPCFVINHIYKEMGLYPKAIVSGGSGIIYASNQIFIISKSQEKEGKEIVGYNFTINIEKSRYVREKSKFPFTVLFGHDIQKWSAMFDFALEAGFINKVSSGWYQIVDPETGEVSENKQRESAIMENDPFFEKLIKNIDFKEFLKTKFCLGVVSEQKSNKTYDHEDENLDDEDDE